MESLIEASMQCLLAMTLTRLTLWLILVSLKTFPSVPELLPKPATGYAQMMIIFLREGAAPLHCWPGRDGRRSDHWSCY